MYRRANGILMPSYTSWPDVFLLYLLAYISCYYLFIYIYADALCLKNI